MVRSRSMEGRTVARLREGSHQEFVGFLILWETGEVSPLWLKECSHSVNLEWLPGEDGESLDLSFLRLG